MIDLHCHILPGLDDGAKTIEQSVAMARIAYEDGVRTIVATPHLSHEFPLDPSEIDDRVEEVNAALRAEGVELTVVRGAEVASSAVFELDRDLLKAACIGRGSYILLEAPYGYIGDGLERVVHDLALDGFRVVLAHPERSACFGNRLDRLCRFTDRGTLCSVTAASLSGRFGRQVRSNARAMLSSGAVHDIASDAHGVERRTPRLMPASDGISDPVWRWLTDDVPAAMIRGDDIPDAPERPAVKGNRAGPLAWLRRR